MVPVVDPRKALANEFASDMDAVRTVEDGSERRKCWIERLHTGSVHMRAIAQTASVGEYHR